jgi:hypothetical protein
VNYVGIDWAYRPSDVRIDLDRQKVGHLPLGLGDDAPASSARGPIATRPSHRRLRPAPSPPEARRASMALPGTTRGLGQFHGAGGRRVDALVPVVPAD